MSIKETLRKMMSNARQTHDSWGHPIQDESMEEKLLRKHMEREHKKKVRKLLAYYDKKHYQEMSSIKMPYHQNPTGKKRKRR